MRRSRSKASAVVCCFVLVACIFCCSCSTQLEDSADAWENVVAIPFSGYLCGVEQSDSLIQVLLLGHSDYPLDSEQISRIYLSSSSKDDMIPCKVSKVLSGKVQGNWTLYTLSFRVEFPEAGEYCVDQLELILNSGDNIVLKQGIIEVEVLSESEIAIEKLIDTKMQINHGDYNSVRISYLNQSSDFVEVCSIDVGNLFLGVAEMTVYQNSDDRLIGSSVIPPQEERAFLFKLEHEADRFQTVEDKFLIMLPKLIYRIGSGEKACVPAQTQATTITPDLSVSYLDSVFLRGASN